MFNIVIYTVETLKKRWKYLRERYVSQRKSLDTSFEHLSRPYLEKMKFLDQHIQPRKSFRNIQNFLTSPTSGNSSHYSEYNVDSRSNNSQKNMSHFGGDSSQHHHYHQQQATDNHQQQQQDTMNALSSAAASALENVNGQVKIEAEIFQNFAAAVASQQLQHVSQSAAAAAGLVDSSQGYQEPYRDNTVSSVSATQNSAGSTGGLTSTSSSMKSPLSSPMTGIYIGNGGQDQEQGAMPSAQQHPPVHSSSSVDVVVNNNNMKAQEHVFNHKGSADSLHSSSTNNYNAKRPRLLNSNKGQQQQQQHQLQEHQQQQHSSNASHYVLDSDDEFDDNSIDLEPTKIMQHDNHYSNSINMQRNAANAHINNNNNNNNQQQQQQQQNMFPSNTDFLFQLYQQLPHQTGSSHSHSSSFGKFQTPSNPSTMQRSSEHLLGELVTTELLKMTKDRRKNVQKRILEILFFDD